MKGKKEERPVGGVAAPRYRYISVQIRAVSAEQAQGERS
jgi:hypothetical protein